MAVGSLREQSYIEVHDFQTEVVTAVLKHHTDMIDSLLRYEFTTNIRKTNNSHITWLISASRDRRLTLWKLIDGKIMTKSEELEEEETEIKPKEAARGARAQNPPRTDS